jgi:hypothetical protein
MISLFAFYALLFFPAGSAKPEVQIRKNLKDLGYE